MSLDSCHVIFSGRGVNVSRECLSRDSYHVTLCPACCDTGRGRGATGTAAGRCPGAANQMLPMDRTLEVKIDLNKHGNAKRM